MKISELNIDELTDEQLKNLVLDNSRITHIDQSNTCVIVLGAHPKTIKKRMSKAKEVYKKCGYKNFFFLGGKGWSTTKKEEEDSKLKAEIPNDKIKKSLAFLRTMKPYANLTDEELMKITEAEVMRQFAVDLGIPEEYIKKEWFSTNTLENMENLISHIEGTEFQSVIIVTSQIHSVRAKLTLLNVSKGAIEMVAIGVKEKYSSDELRKEAKKIQYYITKGDVFDAEVNTETYKIDWEKCREEAIIHTPYYSGCGDALEDGR